MSAPPPRVLLVEDELNMARTLAKNLERAGYVVSHASEGAAALARLNDEPFDVVVTDLKMPGMDGMTLIREARGLSAELAIVIITAVPSQASAIDAVNLGVRGYVTKPFRIPQILDVVDKAVRIC